MNNDDKEKNKENNNSSFIVRLFIKGKCYNFHDNIQPINHINDNKNNKKSNQIEALKKIFFTISKNKYSNILKFSALIFPILIIIFILIIYKR